MKYAVLVLLLALAGCGGQDPRLSQSSQPGAGQLSISGFVNVLQVTTGGTSLGANSVVTQVTFIPQTPQAGPVGTITFCGDVSANFVVNTFATARFTQGQGCSKLIGVTT
jgi:hypothetical protein